ncbi:MAG TPA: Ig-like domain-containing protein [Acidobacteriota bacterium]|nr:Ig-like domain-containing protein [Acidobacteriota bacterium]
MESKPISALLLSSLILFWIAPNHAHSQTKPTMVSTNPANGATGVSRYLASFSMTFSKPMDTTRCGASTRSWPYPPSGQGGSCTWSADKLTMTLTRYNPETPFGPGQKIEAYLVDPEWKVQESYLVDTEGNHLDPPYYFSFTIADWPKVVSTRPPDGATGVPGYLDSISVTFSKPMDTARCGATTNFPYQNGGSCSWSEDQRTMTLTRFNEMPFPVVGMPAPKIGVYLNLPDATPVLRDTDGLNLPSSYFSFTPNIRNGTSLKIPADSTKGFQWPYYLYVPRSIKTPTVLLVEPNNSGTTQKDPSDDDKLAKSLFEFWSYRADDLGSPYLVPTFPRPRAHRDVDTQSLTRATLTTTLPGLVRLDLQLIAMIDDARSRLAAMGIEVGPKFWMIGFSASGDFTTNFSLLHPDRVQAASAGGGAATPPVAIWKGKTLPFPAGVADLKDLVGKSFDSAAYSKVPVQIYMGDKDISTQQQEEYVSPDTYTNLTLEVFGDLQARYPALEAAFKSIGSDCQFIIFPGMGHDYPDWGYIRTFYEHNRTEPFPAALPKPLIYNLYFPHVASFGQWETEIALTSTAEIPVKGELLAMTADGGDPLESIPFAIPAGGRVEYIAGKSFQKPQDIAYIRVRSDSGYLAGYTRFSQPGNRVSLPLVGGTIAGYFPKVERDGWTGIAFVNVDKDTANISLLAYDDNGIPVDTRTLQLAPGRKYVGMVDQLFAGIDAARLRYFKFRSDQKLAGFTVSASSDGQMLDGLQSLGNYMRQR